MSDSYLPPTLSPDDARRIDQACDRFEAAWKAGHRPDPAHYLGNVGEPVRSALLRQLLLLDWEYRGRASDAPRGDEYQACFPGDTALIDDVCREMAGRGDSTRPGLAACSDEPAATVSDRYDGLREVGRGGIGVVYRGRDRRLGREVAVKVLRGGFRDRPDARRRFEEEARVASQLQHPHIVPVYDQGWFGDDRPYFTMKLVEGHTLAELLQARADRGRDRPPRCDDMPFCDRHGPGRPGEAAARCKVDLPRLLVVFEQVCQAAAYAHARRVVHRDLKPANVMVGAFGEVQVMDWGFAKVLPEDETDPGRPAPRPDPAGRAAAAPVSGGYDTSKAGLMIGTPAYMAPEQARGETALVGPRADVFALGAILCEILTGRPPYAGDTAEEICQAAAAGDLRDAHARLAACGADDALRDLARRCLAADRGARPPHAGVVADELAAYLASTQERLQRAQLERAAAEARAEEAGAKVKAERAALRLTVALAAAAALVVTLAAVGWRWYEREQEARALRQASTDAKVEAALAEAAYHVQRNDWARAAAATTRARELAFPENAVPPPDSSGWPPSNSAAHPPPARLPDAGASEPLRRRVAAMEADLDLVAQLDQIRLIQSDFDYDRRRFPRDKALPRYAAAFAEYGIRAGDDPAAVADRVAQRPAAVAAVMTASLDNWWLIAWSERDPTHAWLGDVLQVADPDEWRARVRRAVQEKDRRALEALAAQDDADRQPPTTVTSLSWALLEFEAYDAAIALLKRAQQRHPADYWINLDLGHALLLRQPDHNSEALRFYSIARALRPDLRIYVNLAHLLIQEKDWDGAIVVARKALEAATASDVEGQALAWTNLGIGLERKGDWEGGRAAYRKAIELDRGQVHAQFNLGHSFLRRGEVDAAIPAIEEAIQRSHADARVRSPGIEGQYLRGELGKRYCALGFARFLKQEYAAALTAYDRAIEQNPRHLDSYVQRATALSAMGRLDDAVAAFEQAIRLDPRLEDAHFNLGKVFLDQGRPDRAVVAYARAVELNGKSAENHYSLGVALKLSGDRGGAVAAYRKALALDPNYAVAHWDLGVALVEQGAFREAVAALERGRRLGARPGGTSPEKYLERVRRYLALDAKLPAVLDGSEPPACAGERLEYAVVCQFKGLNAASARLYAEALAEEPALAAAPEADHRYQAARAAALAGRGRGNDAADLDAKERARLRKQALDWLRADLDRWAERLDRSKDGSAAVRAALERWGKDAALAGVREPAELAALPEAERSGYVRLWADVQSLLVRCLAKPRGR